MISFPLKNCGDVKMGGFLSLLLVGVAKDRLILGFLSLLLVGVAKDRLLLAVALFQGGCYGTVMSSVNSILVLTYSCVSE